MIRDTSLTGKGLDDQSLQFVSYKLASLAPGLSVPVPLESTIVVHLKNNAIVTATPATKDLQVIPSLVNVTSQDTSDVGKRYYFIVGVKIENTVYIGDDGGVQCGMRYRA